MCERWVRHIYDADNERVNPPNSKYSARTKGLKYIK